MTKTSVVVSSETVGIGARYHNDDVTYFSFAKSTPAASFVTRIVLPLLRLTNILFRIRIYYKSSTILLTSFHFVAVQA